MKQCPACGSVNMFSETRDISFDYKHEHLVVEQVRGWFCHTCNETLFADGEGARYAAALDSFVIAVDGRQAEELRRIRRKLHLTQKEAAQLFGGGINAFSEYERGVTKPAKSTLLLLKVLDKHPDLVEEIRMYA